MASGIEVKVDEKAGTLTIKMPLAGKPGAYKPSKSGKTSMVATTHGALLSDAECTGSDKDSYPLFVSLNAYIKDR